MTRSKLFFVMLTAMIVPPVLAQDHSAHSGNPTTETSHTPKTDSAMDEHAQHAKGQDAKGSSGNQSLLSEERHIPPDPPTHLMPDMKQMQMRELMEMDDASNGGKVLIDQFEGYEADGNTALAWEAQAWYGGDYNKVWMKTEGERLRGQTEDADVELLWNRIFA